MEEDEVSDVTEAVRGEDIMSAANNTNNNNV